MNVEITRHTKNEGLHKLVAEKGETEAAKIVRQEHITSTLDRLAPDLKQLASDIDALPQDAKDKITGGVLCALALRALNKL